MGVSGIQVAVASNAEEGGLDQEEDHARVTGGGSWEVVVVDVAASTQHCCTASLALSLDMLVAVILGCKPFVSSQTFISRFLIKIVYIRSANVHGVLGFWGHANLQFPSG